MHASIVMMPGRETSGGGICRGVPGVVVDELRRSAASTCSLQSLEAWLTVIEG